MLFISEERSVKLALLYVDGVVDGLQSVNSEPPLLAYASDVKAMLTVVLEESNPAVTLDEVKRYLKMLEQSVLVPASAFATRVIYLLFKFDAGVGA